MAKLEKLLGIARSPTVIVMTGEARIHTGCHAILSEKIHDLMLDKCDCCRASPEVTQFLQEGASSFTSERPSMK